MYSQNKNDAQINKECVYSVNETDDFTGTRKKILPKQDFIKYTSESLKKYFKNDDYIKCQIYCAKINDLQAAYVYWTVQTKNAYKYFGSIRNKADFYLKFKDGSTLKLKYAKSTIGDTSYDKGYTTYSSFIILKKEDLDILKAKEVSKVRMTWSKGFEDYPVVNSKLFINQIPCIL